jgi:predicted alpha/beta hydrolase family esterase
MMSPVRILFVHGGMTFRNRSGYLQYLREKSVSLDQKITWSDQYLREELGKGFAVTKPTMPLKDNAKYSEWKIFFERHLEILPTPFILMGSSLGGVFLAKYLSENLLPTQALSAYFICPPFDDTLPTEDLV